MSKSSINFQTAKSNSSAHMSRDSFVSYLIEHDNNNFEYKHYQDPKEYLELAQVQTKLLTKRNMQSSAVKNFIQEAVLNIKKDTTIAEVENLFKTFNKEFKGGFKVFEIALHKDEGVFVDTKYDVEDLTFDSKTLKVYKDNIDVSNEVIAYAPSKDIFYNPDNQKWYKEKTFENEFDTSKLQKKMNYHAHISFTKWEELTGKNIRLQKSDLQNIQTITAREMKMERGEENSQTKRLNHYQIKKLQSENNDFKKENLATHADLRAEVAKLRAELKEHGATRSDYAALEQMNKELKAKIETKDLTIQELETTKKSYIKAFREILPTAKNEVEVVEYVKTLKNELQATKRLKDELDHTKTLLRASETSKIDLTNKLTAKTYHLETASKKIESLEAKNKTLSSTVAELKEAFNDLRQSLPLAVREKVVKFQEVVSAIKQQLTSPKQQEAKPSRSEAPKETEKKIYMRLGDEPKKEKTREELLSELKSNSKNMQENLEKMRTGLSLSEIQEAHQKARDEQAQKSSSNYQDLSR